MTHSWFPWRCRSSARRFRGTCRPRRSSVPQLLALEDRTLLSVLTVLNNADSGAGSLRDTLAAAQSGDTIVFDPSLAYQTITLTSGPLALSSNLTIDGPGANLLAISGNHASQLFTLSGSAQVTLANLTLTGGMASQGGAVFIGESAALTLDNDVLSGNQAVGDSSGNALGGAVYTSAGASLTVDNTRFLNNQTNGTNHSFGGAVANAGTVVITGATFTGNQALGSTTSYSVPQPGASQGGAIGNLDGATATITGSTFTGNQAMGSGTGDGVGGALCNQDAYVFPFTGTGVRCTVVQCTFANNTAQGGSTAANGGGGGAIEDEPGVSLTVLGCTFTGNQANGGGGLGASGGAIDNQPAVTVTIADSQFLSNSAIGSGMGASAYAGAVDNLQTMTIANCLFTGNRAVGGPMADGMNTFGEGFGGALFSGFGTFTGATVLLTLSNSVIADNEAVGGSGAATQVDPVFTATGFGGGINNGVGGTMHINGCTITGNRALGGAGPQVGGDAFGGGIRNDLDGTLTLTNSTVSKNLCQGGTGASGAAGGVASGAGVDNERGSFAILTNSIISLNQCLGGAGGAGANGGLAVGAGVANAAYPLAHGVADTSSLIVSNCQIVANQAQGGTAGASAVGGDGLGGGLFVGSGSVTLEDVLVNGNQSQGGVDSEGNSSGNGRGGGVYVDSSATVTADTETRIAGNHASKSDDEVFGSINVVP